MSRAYLVAFATAVLICAPAAAQVPSPAKLLVTVADPSGAVIPGATVSILGEDAATKGVTPAPVEGVRQRPRDASRTCRSAATRSWRSSRGSSPASSRTFALKSGDNKHVVILKIKSVEQSVQVSQDRQAAAANPRAAFGTTLTTEEINGLSDDPAEMAQQLIDMAGGNAVIRVDSFLGGPLPPKALIRSIHIVRDAFAAENHSAESDEINIITQPGVGPLHRRAEASRLRDGSMSGKSPFTENKGPEQTQNYDFNVGGTVVPQKASFSLSGGSRHVVRHADLHGRASERHAVGGPNVQQPADGWTTFDLFDYALTKDQILRFA